MSISESRAEVPRSLGELLRRSAARHPKSELVFPEERCSFADMDARADAYASMLDAAGLRPGEHVGIWLPAGLESIAALFGTFRAGGVAVPINDRFRPEEVSFVLKQADIAVLLLCAPHGPIDRPADLLAAFPQLADSGERINLLTTPRLRRIVQIDGDPSAAAFIPASHLGLPAPGKETAIGHTANKDRTLELGADALAYLMFTSGTSAAPKACMISHAGCLLQADSLAFHRYLLDESCSFWCPLPLFHTAGLATLTACLASGATYIHAGTFDPDQSLRTLVSERVTHAVPAFETIWLRILDHPDFPSSDLSRLRVVLMTGGEEQLRKLQSRIPWATQITNFGMTESTGHLSMNRTDDPLDLRVTTGGLPLPKMEVRIVDVDTGEECAPGERGEIQFRGPSRCLGYYGDAEATAEAITPEGWFRSGDLGILDTEGRLTFKGRSKDMMKVGGENVAALEVESFLLRHPDINVVAVVGAPDAYYGEVPAAFVQLAPGASLRAADVVEFCLDTIATYKIPRYVRFVEQWPMSGTKIQKFVLKEQIATELKAMGITEAPRIVSTRALVNGQHA